MEGQYNKPTGTFTHRSDEVTDMPMPIEERHDNGFLLEPMSIPMATRHLQARQRALELIRQFGWNNSSFQTLEPYFHYWFDPEGPGVVAYYEARGTWVAAGAPVSPPERIRSCALGFARAAHEAGRAVCFFGALDRFVDELGAEESALKIGEQPWWNPQSWDARNDRRRSIGSQVRRAERSGVELRQISPEEIADSDSPSRRSAQSVIDMWQRTRSMASMSFVVHLDPFSFTEQRRYFLAERKMEDSKGDRMAVGFLALVPVYARNGWFLEDLIRDPRAPNGTAELMIDGAMRAIAAEGSSYATLGLAPLHGVESSSHRQPGWARRAFALSKRYLNTLYSFEGLAAFKSKFRPDGWEEIYLVGIPRVTPMMLLAVLSAFTRSQPASFAGRTVRRLLVRALRAMAPTTWRAILFTFALLLLLWIGLLASADSSYWFGASSARDIWIAFDATMVLVFTLLGWGAGRRARPVTSLALVAIGAVVTDLFLTSAEGIAFHLHHTGRLTEILLWLVALSGPLLAAMVLFGLVTASREWKRKGDH
jgi:phosphatidylglycerol lysyltransferase